MQQIKDHTKKIALFKNYFNQHTVCIKKDDIVYIIEGILERHVQFRLLKAYGEPYVNYATKVMLRSQK
jgi:carbamoyl-phosphate synthase large subunit